VRKAACAAVETGKGPVVGAPLSWPVNVMMLADADVATKRTAAATAKPRPTATAALLAKALPLSIGTGVTLRVRLALRKRHSRRLSDRISFGISQKGDSILWPESQRRKEIRRLTAAPP
jgi:hypothetical protein